jgi:uncharacterized membrane protein YedE/YeeE
MKRILVAAPFVVFAGAAFAHTSLAPHQHPHAPSALAGLDTLLLAGLIVGFGAALACALRRR